MPAASSDPPKLRHDAALHGVDLLDPDAVVALLGEAGAADDVEGVRLRYLEHDPGRSLSTWYEVAFAMT
ncbi:MAG: hypothetical protein R2733_06245 [Acidimicrobiales bacterium]